MTCEQVKGRFSDWVADRLPEADRQMVAKHLDTCPACREEFEANRELWMLMGQMETPAPGSDMTKKFSAMMENYKESIAPAKTGLLPTIRRAAQNFFRPDYAIRYAYAAMLLLVGGFVGYMLSGKQREEVAYRSQIDTLATEVMEMKRMMMLTLIENPSATERLRAVSYTNELPGTDSRVIEALFTTLNNDPNVNVRLVTLEALTQYGSDPEVRQGLIHALSRQDSPMVQAALADVMVKLQEKRSIRTFRKMLQKDDLNQLVKAKIEQSIRDLS